ncbi:MAG: DUF58 domain-containing protein [Anaerolineales bacterium]
MTSRAVGVTGLFFVCLAAAVISGRQLFFNLAYVWGGLLLTAYVWSRSSLRGVVLQRHSQSSRAQVGHLLEERFKLANESSLPKLWVEVRDRTELPGFRATALTGLGLFGPSDLIGHSGSAVNSALAAGNTVDWLARTVCTQRGRYALGPTELHAGDPFGLFRAERTLPVSQWIVVLPAVFPITSFVIPSGRLPGGDALRHRTHQVTPNASGVRDYEPGDSLNRIHWRSTARRDRLIVKEFEFDPLADVWLVLDAAEAVQHGMDEPDRPADRGPLRSMRAADLARQIPPTTDEYSVSVAASLAFHFMERDRNVGLIAHGSMRQVVQPERGHAQLQRLLESLAVLDAKGNRSIEQVIKIEGDLIPRGATVILISADVSPRVAQIAQDLQRSGKSPVVILLDAASFGGPLGSKQVAESLRRHQTPVKLVRYGDDLGSALSAATNHLRTAVPQP